MPTKINSPCFYSAGLGQVGELLCAGHCERLILVYLVVEFEVVVGVHEVFSSFRSSEAASFFLPGVWHKRLCKLRELCHVFFSS